MGRSALRWCRQRPAWALTVPAHFRSPPLTRTSRKRKTFNHPGPQPPGRAKVTKGHKVSPRRHGDGTPRRPLIFGSLVLSGIGDTEDMDKSLKIRVFRVIRVRKDFLPHQTPKNLIFFACTERTPPRCSFGGYACEPSCYLVSFVVNFLAFCPPPAPRTTAGCVIAGQGTSISLFRNYLTLCPKF